MSTIIILAMVAAFILLRLRSVLGRRTGHEAPPPRDITPKRRDAEAETGDERDSYGHKAASLTHFEAPDETLDKLSPPSRDAAEKIISIEGDFHPGSFIDGAEQAYGMILEAFWAGKLEEVRSYLSDQVYSQFESALKAREADGLVVENRLIEVTDKKIDLIEILDRHARIVVRFVSEIVSLTKDSDGKLVEGDMSDTVKVTDIWTFSREVGSRDRNWALTATRAG
jgi:predicted lipid-binding transport protein (Tim44 family)